MDQLELFIEQGPSHSSLEFSTPIHMTKVSKGSILSCHLSISYRKEFSLYCVSMIAVLKYMAQDGCDRKEAQGNMDAFLENPQGEFALILLSQHIFSRIVPLTSDNLLQKFRLGISKSIGAKRSL